MDDFFKDLKPAKREDSPPEDVKRAGNADPLETDKLILKEPDRSADPVKPDPVKSGATESAGRPAVADQFFHDLKPGRAEDDDVPPKRSSESATTAEKTPAESKVEQAGVQSGPKVDDWDSDDDLESGPTVFFSTYLDAKDWKGFFGHFGSLTREVLTNPKKFFDAMPVSGGLKEPIIYMVVAALINAILQAVMKLNVLSFFGSFFVSIISVAVGAFVANYAFQKLGGKGTLEATIRVFVYSRATLIFAWLWLGPIPVGGMLAGLYSIYLNLVGIQKVHELEDRKTVAILLAVLAAIGFAIKSRTGI